MQNSNNDGLNNNPGLSEDERPNQLEAYQGHEIEDEEQIQPNEEEEGEDIMEDMEADYRSIAKLDEYDINQLDNEEDYSEMDLSQKRKADEEINKRIKREQRPVNNRKLPEFMKDQSDESYLSEALDVSGTLMQQKKEEFYERLGDGELDEEDDEKYHDLEQIRGSLSEWIKDPKTVRFIKRSFRRFLSSFRDEEGELVYEKRIYEMCSANLQSLECG